MGREVRMEFRTLRADEIDVRVAQLGEGKRGKWASLLLYKDARCDMRILDETVGAMDWQRDHKELKGNMYAGIGIWDAAKGQWIWKWDCGTESYTEAEKGEASDSFKRAAFNWGIGRELYTSPTIFLGDDVCKIEKNTKGKLACYDRFSVKSISYDDKRNINGLCIVNSKNRKVVFNWGMTIDEPEPMRSTRSTPNKAENKPKEKVSAESGNSGWQRQKPAENGSDGDDIKKAKHEFIQRCNENGQSAVEIMEKAGWSIDKGDATLDDYAKANIILDERLGVRS